MIYANLRDANRARQKEWDTGGDITLSYAGNELAGEAGELIEAATDILFGGSDVEALKQEIGDVIICCDLIALRCDLELDLSPEVPLFGMPKDIMLDLAIQIGMVANTIKKQERERFGMVGARGSLEDLNRNLNEVVIYVHRLARCFDLDAGSCVADKFNLTSRKYGLKTEMAV